MYKAVALLFLAALLFRYFDAISRVMLIAFLGLIVAMAFNALVVRLPLRRGLATALVALATLAALTVAVWLGTSALIPQVRGLAQDLPNIQETVEGWEAWLQEATGMEIELLGAAELHPFVTLLALLLFAAMFGFLGALLALPIALAIGTVIEVFWVEETLGAGEEEIEPVVQE